TRTPRPARTAAFALSRPPGAPDGPWPDLLERGVRVAGRGHLGQHLADEHRQAAARILSQANGALGAVVAVGHVGGAGPVLGAERDALAGLVGGAHGAGGAFRIPVGAVPGHGARGLRAILHRVALALAPLDHL